MMMAGDSDHDEGDTITSHKAIIAVVVTIIK